VGRLFNTTSPGAAYEETNYDAQGSGSKDARDSLKKLWKRDMAPGRGAARLARGAHRTPPTKTSGPAGPDLVRGIFPSVKTITRSGFGDVAEDEVRRVCEEILTERSLTGTGPDAMPLPYYVSPEQMMKDKAEYAPQGHLARPVHRHARIRRRDSPGGREPRPRCCTRSRRSTTGSRSRASASTTSSRTSGSPGSVTPTSRAIRTAAAT